MVQTYRAPRWLPGGNLQTIWAAKLSRQHLGARPQWQRERWATPDGDFIDVDHLQQPAAAPNARRLVLFHGLEGSSASAYAQAFGAIAKQRGWAYAVPHFRGCSGQINLAPRAYHSGDFEEIGWILARLRAMSTQPLLVVGVSLGGNALLRWAQEAGASAGAVAAAVAAVSSPIDLAAAGRAIDQGFNRMVYARMFLRTMKPRALAKLAQFPGLFDGAALAAADTLYAFDNIFTAPLHGFRDTPDYWRRASAKPALADVRIPALVLNARNDPFVPAASLPAAGQVGRHVTLWQPAHGGHVGFPQGLPPAHVLGMPDAVAGWLAAQLWACCKFSHMDAIVEAALRKWPNVPHCHGWLALDARGNWFMRDERIQAAGPFPQVKGSRIEHAKLLAFIERNYAADASGAWYFQNGPQRVYLQLEAAPWVWRVQDEPGWQLVSHTGQPAQMHSTWLDEHGRLFAHTDIGHGIVHTLDMGLAALAVDAGLWQPTEMPFADMPQRFGYRLNPAG